MKYSSLKMNEKLSQILKKLYFYHKGRNKTNERRDESNRSRNGVEVDEASTNFSAQ
jgi:hypothetical protein